MTSSTYSITTTKSQFLSHVHIMLTNLTQIDIVAHLQCHIQIINILLFAQHYDTCIFCLNFLFY